VTKCVTNGTSCIARRTCGSYTGEIECVIGTDGLCVFDFPVGILNGTKSCRLKICEDFEFTTNAACSIARITGKGTGCVSDGKKCIDKAVCSAYTS